MLAYKNREREKTSVADEKLNATKGQRHANIPRKMTERQVGYKIHKHTDRDRKTDREIQADTRTNIRLRQ